MNRMILLLTGCIALGAAPLKADTTAVLQTYADIAQAAYGDSLTRARILREEIAALLAQPSEAALEAARSAWLEARVPYQQTEVYRFGNTIVDQWEGRVNAWPLDEGLIDYVRPGYVGAGEDNTAGMLNVIATPTFRLGGRDIDATEITPDLLQNVLHEAEEIEANVATGYHAIEFLLWGQDLNGSGPGAGERPWTDYATGPQCTNGNCDRRGDYLRVATDLLVSDLEWMTAQWAGDGRGRARLFEDERFGLNGMLKGMGSMSYGELAGERMKLGLMLNDPEEEHDCFSDNTHNSHYYNGLGIRNIYLGEYRRIDGTVVSGASMSSLVDAVDPELDAVLRQNLDESIEKLGAIKSSAEAGLYYDMMLARGNDEGATLIMDAVDALVEQSRSIGRVVNVLQLDNPEFEGSDSLDNPDAVFR